MCSVNYRLLLLISCCSLGFAQNTQRRNNVCRNFEDYYKIETSPNCYFDAGAEQDLTQLVPEAGYPLQTYELTSSDGYILTLFRLPNVNNPHSNGYAAFLQHGILSHGANFVTLGNASIVYVLWDAGYDVWIGNFRGTLYSQEHVNLTVFDEAYWDHSIDEMATIDMPMILEFITRQIGRKQSIHYIGHSLGTTIALMYAAEFPEHASENVRMFVFMAPAYTLSNMISPYKQFIPLVPKIYEIATDYGLYRLLGASQPAKTVTQIICFESVLMMQLCAQIHNLFYGPTTGVGAEHVPVYYNIVPGGTAIKVLAQAADLVKNNFRKFNYGADNFKKYGALLPPAYDITRIKTPCYVMYGINDWVASKKDAINLYNTLTGTARYGIREINDGDFNHIDFIYGRRAKEYVYDRLLRLFEEFPNKT